jgi:hypothetical protein
MEAAKKAKQTKADLAAKIEEALQQLNATFHSKKLSKKVKKVSAELVDLIMKSEKKNQPKSKTVTAKKKPVKKKLAKKIPAKSAKKKSTKK